MSKPATTTEPPSLAGLVRLCHHRWMVPLVAEIGRTQGARFAVLAVRLGVSRPSLSRALAAAQDANLVMPNPGYGHPLRPEYLLTPWGEAVAGECREVVRAARDQSELIARKWSLPVLAAVASGRVRYSEISRALPTATPRALAQALDGLVQAKCVGRELVDGHPPRPVYSTTRKGRGLARAATRLAEAFGSS